MQENRTGNGPCGRQELLPFIVTVRYGILSVTHGVERKSAGTDRGIAMAACSEEACRKAKALLEGQCQEGFAVTVTGTEAKPLGGDAGPRSFCFFIP